MLLLLLYLDVRAVLLVIGVRGKLLEFELHVLGHMLEVLLLPPQPGPPRSSVGGIRMALLTTERLF